MQKRDNVSSVREIVGDSLARNLFGIRFQIATDAEQLFLAAMASLGDAPYKIAEARPVTAPAASDATNATNMPTRTASAMSSGRADGLLELVNHQSDLARSISSRSRRERTLNALRPRRAARA